MTTTIIGQGMEIGLEEKIGMVIERRKIITTIIKVACTSS